MNLAKPKILIIGNSGFLGSTLTALLTGQIESVSRDQLDLAQPLTNEFKKYLKDKKFDYIVISAALTDVEKCYQDQTLSQKINVDGVIELLDQIKSSGATPVFFSSDYVYKQKDLPYREDDEKMPQTIYGNQKLFIEKYLEAHFENFLVFRTSKLMSKKIHQKNILYSVIRDLKLEKIVGYFEDQWLNPIFVEDIADILNKAFFSELTGIYNLGTKKVFTRLELARFLANAFNLNQKLIAPIKMSDIKFSEIRPNNNSLNCTKIENYLNFRFCEIEEALPVLKNNLIL